MITDNLCITYVKSKSLCDVITMSSLIAIVVYCYKSLSILTYVSLFGTGFLINISYKPGQGGAACVNKANDKSPV